MSISTIRRQVKNVAYNFSDAQVKVREATSNDPWGPSTELMSKIADLTHKPMEFLEIMSMIWKRLNDSGKNWRHVYKSLVLLDFLIKCGHEKVTKQCRENVFTIQTLEDFQYVEDNKDQGLNVRQKAKQITRLLSDEEYLKSERSRFMTMRKKFKKNNPEAVGAKCRGIRRQEQDPELVPELENSRPSTVNEEEMQLQIALALSKQECLKVHELQRSDDARLQMALEESQKLQVETDGFSKPVASAQPTTSALDDLLSLGELPGATASQEPFNDPWAMPQSAPELGNEPWPMATPMGAPAQDPFWEPPVVPAQPVAPTTFDLLGGDMLFPFGTMSTFSAPRNTSNPPNNTVQNFLGENATLVNLDDLLGSNTPSTSGGNPFLPGPAPPAPNPFAQQRKSPTLNEMRAAQAPPLSDLLQGYPQF